MCNLSHFSYPSTPGNYHLLSFCISLAFKNFNRNEITQYLSCVSDSFHSADCSPEPSMLCKWQDFPFFVEPAFHMVVPQTLPRREGQRREHMGRKKQTASLSYPAGWYKGLGMKWTFSECHHSTWGPAGEQWFWTSNWHSLQKCFSDCGSFPTGCRDRLQSGYGLG